MEWNSIKMSKAEFERLQKEYTAAAIKTAEKAKRSAISKETPVATQQPAPTVGIIYETSSTIAEATEENAAETESVVNEIADVSEPVVNKAEKITISPESNDIEISAEATENDTEEISAEPEPEASENNENSEFNEDNTEMPQDTSDIRQEDKNCDTDSSGNSINECDTAEEHTDEEILDSFASVFMSEDEADKKVEKLYNGKQKNCPPPNFNSAIHNQNMSNSKKPCGCEHCRCQSGNRMQEKGGQNPD